MGKKLKNIERPWSLKRKPVAAPKKNGNRKKTRSNERLWRTNEHLKRKSVDALMKQGERRKKASAKPLRPLRNMKKKKKKDHEEGRKLTEAQKTNEEEECRSAVE